MLGTFWVDFLPFLKYIPSLGCIAEEKVAWALRAATAGQDQGSSVAVVTTTLVYRADRGRAADCESSPLLEVCSTTSSRSPSPTLSLPASMSLPPSTTASTPLPEAFPLREPAYSPGSPFAAIAALLPPHIPRRTTLHSASAHEVLVLAMDEFARGIFRMPHVQLRLHSHSHTTSHPYSLYQPFSRAAQLFSIATSILGVAERLRLATQRAHWAQQADGVLAQMRMEGLEAGVRVHAHAFPHTHPHNHAAHSHSPTHSLDGAWAEEDWRGAVAGARGRCWLVVGTARGESSETALEGDADPAVVLCVGLVGKFQYRRADHSVLGGLYAIVDGDDADIVGPISGQETGIVVDLQLQDPC
ncbi:hypothetical protein OBBRIDRAFT_794459 [Obba rivulosa]|uniref:Uncharacterized protein n=1 Tax=Obba rivulosa TaxID=1052685 RepID=A0A8E2ARI1_9APHY|nr:hypothetical protein OBBRIDRAFT_794459 [Obba rivulosa]